MEVKWRVFVLNRFKLDEVVHIVPTISGAIMNPHRLSTKCSCNPAVEGGSDIRVIHNMIH